MIRPVHLYRFAVAPASDPVLPEAFGDEPLKTLVADMWETLTQANAVGLSAMQIGVFNRVCVIDFRKEYDDSPYAEDMRLTCCNLEILEREGKQVGQEGCLSLPRYTSNRVTRPHEVFVRFQDADGVEKKMVAGGLLARAFCHEADHAEGRYYWDHAPMRHRTKILSKYRVDLLATGTGRRSWNVNYAVR